MEPIAIVGLACRLPGDVSVPERFWEVLAGGIDATRDVPRERFEVGAYPELASRRGAFVSADLAAFDAGYFGLSARECAAMDPQLRLLLEVTAEALADAGIPRPAIAGSHAAVYVGSSNHDREPEPAPVLDGGRCALANGLSRLFDLHGPSMLVDTACSSTAAALHLACEHLRQHGGVALAGGANLVTSPRPGLALSAAGLLSPTGRCRFGDARADGYVRAEAVGMLVLKRLDEALADGSRVHAVIRASGMSQDGRDPGGQAALMKAVWAAAGVSAEQLDYVEAHGAGLRASDAAELRALGLALGGRERPCFVGSVKTNVGHAEGASTLPALLKVVLALRHREIPASLHMEVPLPEVPWEAMPLRINGSAEPWPETGRPGLAALNAFGLTGTNVHLVLEAAVDPRPAPAPSPWLHHPLPSSAKSEPALRAELRHMAAFLRRTGASVEDVGFTAGRHATHEDWRYAAVGRDHAELAAELERAGAGLLAVPLPRSPRLAFVFSGEEAGWPGMGRWLLEGNAEFRRAIAELDALRPDLGLGSGLADGRRADALGCFAVQLGLLRVLASAGVAPQAVLGQGSGEVTAACAAGALSPAEALAVLARRAAGGSAAEGAGGSAAAAGAEAAAGLRLVPKTPRLPFYGATDAEDGPLDAAYWERQAMGPSAFQPAVERLLRDGYDTLVEVTPHATVGGHVLDIATRRGALAMIVPTMARGDEGDRTLMRALALLYTRGCAIDWAALYPQGRVVSLPPYPFQRGRYGQERQELPAALPPAPSAGEHWFYDVAWEVGELGEPGRDDGHWLVFSNEEGTLRQRLGRRRNRLTFVRAGHKFIDHGKDGFTIDPTSPQDYRAVIEALAGRGHTPSRLVLRWPAEENGEAWRVLPATTCQALLAAFQAMLTSGAAARFWLVTADGVDPRGAVVTERVAMAGFAAGGMARSLALEYPEAWGGHVDLDDAADDPLAWAGEPLDELVLACRGGVPFVPRLVQREPDATPLPVEAEGCYLVTGGLGQAGRAVAEHLARRGAGELVLVGRLGPAHPEAGAITAKLEALGARVHVLAIDVTRWEDVERLEAYIDRHCRPLRGVVHGAGSRGEQAAIDLTAEELMGQMAPKVLGGWHLHGLTMGRPLDFFVMFSSTTAVWGGLGQVAACAANAFLDGLAAYRRGLGLPGSAQDWGLWADRAGRAPEPERAGVLPMPVSDALVAFDRAGSGAIVARMDWPRFIAAFTARRPTPFFAAFAPEAAEPTQAGVLERWWYTHQPRPDADVRLLCFPGAGADPAAFAGCVAELPDTIEPVSVVLPGRLQREEEAPFRRLAPLVDRLAAALLPLFDRPVVCLGHGLGALVMFETVHRLQALGGVRPLHLVVAGARAPQSCTPEQVALDTLQFSPVADVPPHALGPAELQAFLDELGFPAGDVPLATIQADLELHDAYTYTPRPPLAVPITAIGARLDPLVSAQQLDGWREHTRAAFGLHIRPGGHHFLDQEQRFLARLVADLAIDP